MSRTKRLYVIACRDLVKIGVSSDPIGRMRQLQTGSPHYLKLVLIALFDGCPQPLEKDIHKALAQHRVRGEWFKLDDLNHLEALITSVAYFRFGLELIDLKTDAEALYADGLLDEETFIHSGYRKHLRVVS